MGKVSDALEILKSRESSMGGDELQDLLTGLGFEVRPTSSGKHHDVTHDGLDGFYSTSFDKGHKKHMLPSYPRSIRSVIKQYQTELEKLLGEANGQA